MKLPESAHLERPWRIHEIAPDFRLEDVWALPTPGGPGGLPEARRLMVAFDPGRDGSAPVRALFALRWKIGEIFGWDEESAGLGERVSTASRPPARRPARRAPRARQRPAVQGPLYLTEDEWALEIANGTVHGVLHVGWVEDGTPMAATAARWRSS